MKHLNNKCAACGKKWTDHLGIAGTCAKYQSQTKAILKAIKWIENAQKKAENSVGRDISIGQYGRAAAEWNGVSVGFSMALHTIREELTKG